MDEDVARRRRELVEMFHAAPIAKSFGMTLSYDEAGRAIFAMPYHPGFNHYFGGIHGGVFATLLDNAGWFTVAPHYDRWIATVEFGVKLLEPVKEEALQAVGRVVRAGKRLAVAEMEVRTAGGQLAAMGSGTFAISSTPMYPSTP